MPRITDFVASQRERVFVRQRIDENVSCPIRAFSHDLFWHRMVACLLTTQQRSGPGSAVDRFISVNPFPLSLTVCRRAPQVDQLVAGTITAFGGLRRANKIGRAAQRNLRWLEQEGWQEIDAYVRRLLECRSREPRTADKSVERTAARFIMQNMDEFGPKQSRNLLQSLGLTRFEIPIDSRITKWLNATAFPMRLASAPLGDTDYYEFVMDGIQAICERCSLLPCVLDAAIFASFDTE